MTGGTYYAHENLVTEFKHAADGHRINSGMIEGTNGFKKGDEKESFRLPGL